MSVGQLALVTSDCEEIYAVNNFDSLARTFRFWGKYWYIIFSLYRERVVLEQHMCIYLIHLSFGIGVTLFESH